MENHSFTQDYPSSSLEGSSQSDQAVDLITQTELERLIGQIWSKVLQVDAVGLNDNFFDLGGHSLAIVKVYDQLRASLPNHPAIAGLEMVELFEHPTVGALAAFLARGRNIKSRPGARRGNKKPSATRQTKAGQVRGEADE
jgi:Phosphopantetheine attachment site